MRHRYSGRKLNKTSSHKRAMFRNMTASLVEHELIKTTLPKAKELRGFAEPLITLAKEDSVANRRLAFDRLRNKEAVGKLFSEFGPRYQNRPGGYTRILKCGFRTGDAAPMAYIELVDRPMVSEELEEDFASAQALPTEEAVETAPASEDTAAAEETVEASADSASEEQADDSAEKKEDEKKDG